jgi:hypothetical protein
MLCTRSRGKAGLAVVCWLSTAYRVESIVTLLGTFHLKRRSFEVSQRAAALNASQLTPQSFRGHHCLLRLAWPDQV